MTHVSRMESLRQRVRAYFLRQGAPAEATIRESILIRQGYYCGRRFLCDGLAAVWFDDEQELKLSDRRGAVVEVLHDPFGRGAGVTDASPAHDQYGRADDAAETSIPFPVWRSEAATDAGSRRAA